MRRYLVRLRKMRLMLFLNRSLTKYSTIAANTKTQNRLTAILSTNQMTNKATIMTRTAVKGFFIKSLSMAFSLYRRL